MCVTEMSSGDSAEKQEMRDENDELQDQEQFEKSEEFEDQGFEYGAPLDDNPEHTYSEGHAEQEAEAETYANAETGFKKKRRPKA